MIKLSMLVAIVAVAMVAAWNTPAVAHTSRVTLDQVKTDGVKTYPGRTDQNHGAWFNEMVQ